MAGINIKKIRQAVISVRVPLETLSTKGDIKNDINNNHDYENNNDS